jgi:hypothetical protein
VRADEKLTAFLADESAVALAANCLDKSFTVWQSKTILARSFAVDAHRGNGKRFVVHAEEKLGAFLS